MRKVGEGSWRDKSLRDGLSEGVVEGRWLRKAGEKSCWGKFRRKFWWREVAAQGGRENAREKFLGNYLGSQGEFLHRLRWKMSVQSSCEAPGKISAQPGGGNFWAEPLRSACENLCTGEPDGGPGPAIFAKTLLSKSVGDGEEKFWKTVGEVLAPGLLALCLGRLVCRALAKCLRKLAQRLG